MSPIHWKISSLYNIEILRALRFKSLSMFLKCPLVTHICQWIGSPISQVMAMLSVWCQVITRINNDLWTLGNKPLPRNCISKCMLLNVGCFFRPQCVSLFLTHKQLETHGNMLSMAATDALMLKHQAISIHSVDCRIWSWSPVPCEKHGPRDSVDKNRGRRPRFLSLLRPEGHVFHTAWETMIKCYYSTLADWLFSMFYSHKYEF